MNDPQQRNRKTGRNRRIVRMVRDFPEIPLREIGAHFNMSKQRVSKIYRDYGGKGHGR